ncbi:diguanylate cyclase [Arsukibacterium sp. UBA3155]|uniref:diguanylate cyclase n=1 Tax=Arsukibacterium sp. UBA3155 TaxID=1946058 RepID=UPI0025B8EA58|nr:diguanylate cyclase [Arsukibacterium sp. UBA3155]|tara:strand:+ start:107949 stop:109445 length:1497 start_codon:yes stop_codon:yes gene_type:complete
MAVKNILIVAQTERCMAKRQLRYKVETLKNIVLSACLLVWSGLFSVATHADQAATSEQLLTYCVDPDWMPYESIQDGEHIGISADYVSLISQKTGLQFQLVPTTSWLESLQYLQNGKCQLSPMLNRSAERETYLHFSDVYFRSPNVLVSLKEQPFLQSIENIGTRSLAVPEGYRLSEYVKRYYPETPLVLVDNEPAGLQAVAEGDADLFIGSLYSINNQIRQESLYHLKVAGWVGLEDELRFGVVSSARAVIPVINQALANITEQEHIDIYQKWTRIEVIDVVNYQLLWQVAGVAIAIILLLTLWNYRSRSFYLKLQEKNQLLEQSQHKLESAITELEFLSNHDPLTKLYNRNHFDKTMQHVQRRSAQAKDVLSLIVIDIDFFKDINDNHGHSVGDAILQELAKILLDKVREHDQVTRWGGEEFVILCPKTTAAEAQALCQRIALALTKYVFHCDIRLSCSFGVAEQHTAENLLKCFERADRALYQAKQNGRNQICLA